MPDENGKPEDLTAGKIAGALSVKAWWGILGAVVALVVGAVALGVWVQSIRDEAEKGDLKRQLATADERLNSVVSMLNDENKRERSILSKSEFLERFLSYKLAPDSPAAKDTFVGYVCALWKNSEQKNVQVDEKPMDLSPDKIRAGLSPELKQFLRSKGVPDLYFDHAEHPPQQTVVAPFNTVVIGYEDSGSFRKVFRRVVGLSPGVGLVGRVGEQASLALEAPENATNRQFERNVAV
jgi:hypothetical protein